MFFGFAAIEKFNLKQNRYKRYEKLSQRLPIDAVGQSVGLLVSDSKFRVSGFKF